MGESFSFFYMIAPRPRFLSDFFFLYRRGSCVWLNKWFLMLFCAMMMLWSQVTDYRAMMMLTRKNCYPIHDVAIVVVEWCLIFQRSPIHKTDSSFNWNSKDRKNCFHDVSPSTRYGCIIGWMKRTTLFIYFSLSTQQLFHFFRFLTKASSCFGSMKKVMEKRNYRTREENERARMSSTVKWNNGMCNTTKCKHFANETSNYSTQWDSPLLWSKKL